MFTSKVHFCRPGWRVPVVVRVDCCPSPQRERWPRCRGSTSRRRCLSRRAPCWIDGRRRRRLTSTRPAAALAKVVGAQDQVRRSRRAIPIALAAVPALVVIASSALMLPYLFRLMTNPQNVEILSGLSALQNPNPPAGSRLRSPDIRSAIERYLAGRHGHVLADDRFWSTLIMQRMAGLRPIAADLVARYPAVSAAELAQASETIAPERRRWVEQSRVQIRGLLTVAGLIVSTVTALAIALVVVLSLVSAALAPGGMAMRSLGYTVVSREGREIGRGRSLLRAVAAWLPAIVWLAYLAASPKIQGSCRRHFALDDPRPTSDERFCPRFPRTPMKPLRGEHESIRPHRTELPGVLRAVRGRHLPCPLSVAGRGTADARGRGAHRPPDDRLPQRRDNRGDQDHHGHPARARCAGPRPERHNLH